MVTPIVLTGWTHSDPRTHNSGTVLRLLNSYWTGLYKHKWVVTPLGPRLSAIRSREPEHTGSRISIRTATRGGFGFRAPFDSVQQDVA